MYTRSTDEFSSLVAPSPHKRQIVARHIRALAASLVPGDRLPSVSDLEQQLGVARKTVVAALELLQKEGIIDSRPRSGTFVAERVASTLQSPLLQSASTQNKTNTLTLFAYRPTGYYLSWINCLVVQAGAMGLNVNCQYTVDRMDAEHIANCLAVAPLGAISLSLMYPELIQCAQSTGQRVVLISEPRIGFELYTPYICSDAEQGGYLATRHLLEMGHRRIAYVHWMPADQELLSRLRWRGHVRALEEVDVPVSIIGAERFTTWREYPEVLRHDMRQADAPTAFAAWSDIEAAELVPALQRAGLSVPGDVSVIGYDNLARSVESEPRLSTVDQNMKILAQRALSLLLNPDAYEEARALQIAQAQADSFAPVGTPRLIRRESTQEYTTKR